MPLSGADFRQNNKIAVGLNRCNSSLNARNIDNNGDKQSPIERKEAIKTMLNSNMEKRELHAKEKAIVIGKWSNKMTHQIYCGTDRYHQGY